MGDGQTDRGTEDEAASREPAECALCVGRQRREPTKAPAEGLSEALIGKVQGEALGLECVDDLVTLGCALGH